MEPHNDRFLPYVCHRRIYRVKRVDNVFPDRVSVSVPPPRFAVIAAYARLLGWRSAGLTCMVNKDVLDECSERMGADGEDLCALTDRCAAAMERAPTAIWATADAPGPQHGSDRRGLSRLGATA